MEKENRRINNISTRITDEERKQLIEVAKKEKKSQSELIRIAVNKYCEGTPKSRC